MSVNSVLSAGVQGVQAGISRANQAAGDIARPMHSVSFAVADGVLAGTALHRSLVFPIAA